MNYKILEAGKEINVIVAELDFVESYCAKNGYTYELMPKSEPIPDPEQEPNVWDELDAAYQEGVNSAYDQ